MAPTATRRRAVIDTSEKAGPAEKRARRVAKTTASPCKDGETCPICLQELESLRNLSFPCKHQFHRTCAIDWLESRKFVADHTCPNCRKRVLELTVEGLTEKSKCLAFGGPQPTPSKVLVLMRHLVERVHEQGINGRDEWLAYLKRTNQEEIEVVRSHRTEAVQKRKHAAWVEDIDKELEKLDKRARAYDGIIFAEADPEPDSDEEWNELMREFETMQGRQEVRLAAAMDRQSDFFLRNDDVLLGSDDEIEEPQFVPAQLYQNSGPDSSEAVNVEEAYNVLLRRMSESVTRLEEWEARRSAARANPHATASFDSFLRGMELEEMQRILDAMRARNEASEARNLGTRSAPDTNDVNAVLSEGSRPGSSRSDLDVQELFAQWEQVRERTATAPRRVPFSSPARPLVETFILSSSSSNDDDQEPSPQRPTIRRARAGRPNALPTSSSTAAARRPRPLAGRPHPNAATVSSDATPARQ